MVKPINLNHFFIHLLNVLLKEALDHLPLEFEGGCDHSRLGGPGLRHQGHHLGDFKLFQIGFDSMGIDVLDDRLTKER